MPVHEQPFNTESKTMVVTPQTDFRVVFNFLKDGLQWTQAQDQFFVRNFANNGSFYTKFYAFTQGIVFEVIPDPKDENGGKIANVQLFQAAPTL